MVDCGRTQGRNGNCVLRSENIVRSNNAKLILVCKTIAQTGCSGENGCPVDRDGIQFDLALERFRRDDWSVRKNVGSTSRQEFIPSDEWGCCLVLTDNTQHVKR